jgi:O-antigen ligase
VETAVTHATTRWPRALHRGQASVSATWALAAGLVLYLGFQGGGYDVVVSSQVGLVLWWILLIGAAAGILPNRSLSRSGWVGVGLLLAFVAYTALASTWSLSSEDTLQEFSRVSTYLAVLLLALAVHRNREQALRHTISAVAIAIVVVAGFAVISRLFPNSFPSADVTTAFLPGSRERLSWPLNYWNGLAALMALGLPLLLAVATSARSLLVRAAAAAGIPLVVLCAFLTLSRGGEVAAAVALVAFLALTSDRIPKLATVLTGAAGSAIAIEATVRRYAVDHGLSGHVAATQGRAVAVTLALSCVGVAVAQLGIGMASRHGTPPRWLSVSVSRARLLLTMTVVVAIVLALALGLPGHLSHAWHDFKYSPTNVSQSNLTGRLSDISGDGRYALWKVALESTANKRWFGSGPGSFQLLWQQHQPVYGPAVNAHSLYIETLAEDGIVGLALLVGFFALLLTAAVRAVIHARDEDRVRAAGATAALLAFMVSAAADWVWQLPVLPAAFMLLAAAVLTPSMGRKSIRQARAGERDVTLAAPGSRRRLIVRCGLGVLAAACLVGVAVPLAAVSDVRQSQNAATAGDYVTALQDARSAVRVEPGAASPEIQLALVLELRHQFIAAVSAAGQGTRDEPQNWDGWLVLSRLQAESGHAVASVADYRRARSLNPTSPLFDS